MAETLQQYPGTIVADDATEYEARACGVQMPDGLWHGWIEFDLLGDGKTIRSGRETTQPNRTDIIYWASGLSHVYLEGALRRALEGPIVIPTLVVPPAAFDAPAPSSSRVEVSGSSVLDPFSGYERTHRPPPRRRFI